MAPRIAQWKESAAREGARQAWACVKSHFPDLPLEPIVESNPKDANGNPVLPDAYFEVVMPVARRTEQARSLNDFIQ